MKKVKGLIRRIRNREFGYIIKRLSLYLLRYIYGEFYMHRFTYNVFVSTHWTRMLNIPKDYSYVIAGSHGVGFASFIKYMQAIEANPMTLDNLFASSDYALIAYKHARKHQGKIYGLSFDKAYMDNLRRKILTNLDSRVPVFSLVRDPISILRTHTHGYILPTLINGIKNNEIILHRGGLTYNNKTLREKIFTDISMMIDFLIIKILKESKIIPFFCFTSLLKQLENTTKEIVFIDTMDITTCENTISTMDKIAKILNINSCYKNNQFSINHSSINVEKHFFPVRINNTEFYSTSPNKPEEINHKLTDIHNFILNGGIENIVLDFLYHNNEYKNDVRKFLEYELSIVQDISPDIIKKWQYYKIFLDF